MTCNCNCSADNNTISFIKGTTFNVTFNFDEDISTYTQAEFVIRKDYTTSPVINKTIPELSALSFDLELTPGDTNSFTEFANGKNSARYIWGLDLVDSVNNIRVNVFPQTGEPAPLCIVYKHV